MPVFLSPCLECGHNVFWDLSHVVTKKWQAWERKTTRWAQKCTEDAQRVWIPDTIVEHLRQPWSAYHWPSCFEGEKNLNGLSCHITGRFTYLQQILLLTHKRSQNMTHTIRNWQTIFVDVVIRLKITNPQIFADPTTGYKQALSHPAWVLS